MSEPQTTVLFDWGKRKWGAACRDCKWVGPERETHDEAREDQLTHLRENHEVKP